MRRFSIACLILVGILAVGCTRRSVPEESSTYALPAAVGAEVAQSELADVFDDQSGTAYIKLDEPVNLSSEMDSGMSEIFRKKAMWHAKFPTKKVLSLCTVSVGGGYTYVTGAILTYEVVK